MQKIAIVHTRPNSLVKKWEWVNTRTHIKNNFIK